MEETQTHLSELELQNEYDQLEDKPETAPPRPLKPKPKPIVIEEPVPKKIKHPRPDIAKRIFLWTEDSKVARLSVAEATKSVLPSKLDLELGRLKQEKVWLFVI